MPRIPVINIAALFESDETAKTAVDHKIAEAAFDIGFMVVTGYPSDVKVGVAERRKLLKLFDLPQDAQRPYWKRNFAPENPHIYRGWFPLSSSRSGGREGYEIGPDIVRDLPVDQADDLLYEPTPLPDPELLPEGWRETAAAYYLGAEKVGQHLLASLSRSLGIDESIFADAFDVGISTLRLLHYPNRETAAPDGSVRYVEHNGKSYETVARRACGFRAFDSAGDLRCRRAPSA